MEDDYLSHLSLSFGVAKGDYLSTGGRALGDYLSSLPEATEEEALIKSCRSFIIHRDDYIYRMVVGIITDQAGLVWVAGDGFPYRLKEEEGKTVIFLPPLVCKCTKKDLKDMPANELKAKMTKETLSRVHANFAKAGYQKEITYTNLDQFIDSDLSKFYKRFQELEAATARGMDLGPVSLEQLSSPNFDHALNSAGTSAVKSEECEDIKIIKVVNPQRSKDKKMKPQKSNIYKTPKNGYPRIPRPGAPPARRTRSGRLSKTPIVLIFRTD